MSNICLNNKSSDSCIQNFKGVGWGIAGSLSAIVTLVLAILAIGVAIGGLVGGGYLIYQTAITKASMIPVAILINIPQIALCILIGYGIAHPAGGMLSVTGHCFRKAKKCFVENMTHAV